MGESVALGRRIKLTPEVQEKVVAAISNGSYAVVAAELAGISESTYYAWKQRGEEDLAAGNASPYLEFLEAIKNAEAAIEMRLVASCTHAAIKQRPDGSYDWKAAMTFMERRWPNRWSRNERREHSGTVKVAPVNLSALSMEELDQLERLTAKAEGIELPPAPE